VRCIPGVARASQHTRSGTTQHALAAGRRTTQRACHAAPVDSAAA